MHVKSISESFVVCVRAFEEGLGALQGHGKVPLSKWNDEIGRLRVWAANIGAQQTGQSSLDFRLRDAPHIHQKFLQLFDDLIEAMNEIHELFPEPENKQPDEHDVTTLDGTNASEYKEDPESEIEQLHESCVNIIDCLFQVSMLVHKPARHINPTGLQLESNSGLRDRSFVLKKFPAADMKVAERLGRANTRRRVYLRHREQQRLGSDKDVDEAEEGSLLSGTATNDFTMLQIGREALQSGTSVTIPPAPKESAGRKPFKCPCCFYIITIAGPQSWAQHVFQDLLAYVCPFLDCPAPEKLYNSKHDWYGHLRASHMSVIDRRVCPLCEASIGTATQFKHHLARHLEDLALFVLPVKAEPTDGGHKRLSAPSNWGIPYYDEQHPATEGRKKRKRETNIQKEKSGIVALAPPRFQMSFGSY
ncbi:MAG: hypothetical protein L6R39_002092 [Caloplaca ligustica]|nr:MAG: hypothetical protein L6R39_002092 [Caloplaca ligustica]